MYCFISIKEGDNRVAIARFVLCISFKLSLSLFNPFAFPILIHFDKRNMLVCIQLSLGKNSPLRVCQTLDRYLSVIFHGLI